jgi:sulfhydrogenase subunit gamma (sulfur reductase)
MNVGMNRSSTAEPASYIPFLAKVTEARKMTDREILLDLQMSNGRPLGHEPGQFIMVSIFGIGEAPISVCSSPTRAPSFQLCIRAAGDLTERLNQTTAGEILGIRGPYGRGFPVETMQKRDILIIAGGIGLAPLRSLIQYILDKRPDFGRLILIYGAKDPASILFKDEVMGWRENRKVELYLTVDRSDATWRGRVGTLVLPLRELRLHPATSLVVASVGPPAMYRFVAVELFKKGLHDEQIFFSVERRFKCGIGKCGHCQLNDRYVCQDGPVFQYSELMGRPEAGEVWAPEKDRDKVGK